MNEDYTQAGFDQFLQRGGTSQQDTGSDQQLTALDFQTSYDSFSPNQIASAGKFTSKDGRVVLDMELGFISISDGQKERVRLGKASDTDESGIQIWDQNGNQLIKILGTVNFIQSPDKHTIFDFDKNNIRVSEDNNVRVLLGKDPGGF